MKIAANIAGGLLGLIFVAFPLMAILGFAPKPAFPPDSASDHFMKAFVPTGYIMVVQVFQIVGGILIAIPKTRNLGLLVLGAIIINIFAFHLLVLQGGLNPVHALLVILPLFLLWVERRAFAGLIH